jgi:hypothetical protein
MHQPSPIATAWQASGSVTPQQLNFLQCLGRGDALRPLDATPLPFPRISRQFAIRMEFTRHGGRSEISLEFSGLHLTSDRDTTLVSACRHCLLANAFGV